MIAGELFNFNRHRPIMILMLLRILVYVTVMDIMENGYVCLIDGKSLPH